MNLLQEDGIISDLCVWAEDVADCDCGRAIEFLQRQPANQIDPEL